MKRELNFESFLKYIKNDEPFFINRLGGSDIKTYFRYNHTLKVKGPNEDFILNTIKYISEWNGYYDCGKDTKEKKERLENFFKELHRIYKENEISTNACGFVENYGYTEMFEDVKFQYIDYHHYIEKPNIFFNSILPVFNNKKILVVSPFTDLIKDQSLKINDLHKINENYDFLYLKTSITYFDSDKNDYLNAPNSNFFETIKEYQKEIEGIDFDLAILGCGTYAHFLGDYIKKIGKKAIYVGGVLPVYFGIFGDRHVTRKTEIDYNFCVLNNFEILHSKNVKESLNDYLYHEYKYEEKINRMKDYKYHEILSKYNTEDSKKIFFINNGF